MMASIRSSVSRFNLERIALTAFYFLEEMENKNKYDKERRIETLDFSWKCRQKNYPRNSNLVNRESFADID